MENKKKIKVIFIICFVLSVILLSIFPKIEYDHCKIMGPLDYGLTNGEESRIKIDNISKKYDLDINKPEIHPDSKEWKFFENKLSRRINFGIPITIITLQDYPYIDEYLFIIIIEKNITVKIIINILLYFLLISIVYLGYRMFMKYNKKRRHS